MKYNLTFWQKVNLPFLWWYWKMSVLPNKKSWHEVKKGIEKHEHKFTKLVFHTWNGKVYEFKRCEHEGCYACSPVNEEKIFELFDALLAEYKELQNKGTE